MGHGSRKNGKDTRDVCKVRVVKEANKVEGTAEAIDMHPVEC